MISAEKLRYLFLRVGALWLISIIFRSFDTSYNSNIYPSDIRKHGYVILFILVGLVIWSVGGIIARATERWYKRRDRKVGILYPFVFVMTLYGMISSLFMGFCHYLYDTQLFGLNVFWSSYRGFSYDLNFGLFFFYLVILSYEGIAYYYKNWQQTRLRTEILMKENIQSRYNALQQQIDPHFFFNSLSVLSNLVHKDPDLSTKYIFQLSKTYRYILDRKIENLTNLESELDFVQSYLFLIKIRHIDGIEVKMDIPEIIKKSRFLPPAALQLLIENAVKHNSFSVNSPLVISIYVEGENLIVENAISKREVPGSGTGLGLDNIRKRYELLGGEKLKITNDGKTFSVTLPLFKEHRDESSNN